MANNEAIKEIQSWTPVLLSSGNCTDKSLNMKGAQR